MIDGGPQSLALAESRSRTVSSVRGFGIQTFEALGEFSTAVRQEVRDLRYIVLYGLHLL